MSELLASMSGSTDPLYRKGTNYDLVNLRDSLFFTFLPPTRALIRPCRDISSRRSALVEQSHVNYQSYRRVLRDTTALGPTHNLAPAPHNAGNIHDQSSYKRILVAQGSQKCLSCSSKALRLVSLPSVSYIIATRFLRLGKSETFTHVYLM